jgi:hypothetical protein
MTTPNNLGQLVMARSMPVAIASDQTSVPVSFAGGVDVTDRPARQVGIVSITGQPISVVTQEPISVDDNGGSLTVDGTVAVSNFPAVQPVNDNGGSLTVDGAVDVTDRAARLIGVVHGGVTPAGAFANPTDAVTTFSLGGLFDSGAGTWARWTSAAGLADNNGGGGVAGVLPMLLDPAGTYDRATGNSVSGQRMNLERATLIVPVSPAANAGATITLPAAGAGLFHYITHIHIARHATAALAGGGTLTITTTNLNGLTWRVGNQASITVAIMQPGVLIDSDFAHPLRSAVSNTATTIVLPAPGAAVLWTAWCAYYVGP